MNQAIDRALEHGFDGLEANLQHPSLASRGGAQAPAVLEAAGLDLIVELVTGGDYVPPLHWRPADHLRQLAELLELAVAWRPCKVSVITGCDAWPWAEQLEFWANALALAETCGLVVSFETHRSRSFYSPWTMPAYLEAFPSLRFTADLSHWCAVAERLMTPELLPVQMIAPRVEHIHARVGHAQGPSVGHPFAPEWAEALEAHRRCWQLFACSRAPLAPPFTITPEFGPDGYLPELPFSREPVADLREINAAMARWIREGALDSEPTRPASGSGS